MCGEFKNATAFYFHPDSRKHRSQCMECDDIWKKIHHQIRKQHLVGFYYERVKPHRSMRQDLFDTFRVAKDLGLAPSEVSIKFWAERQEIWPADPGAANRPPAPGGALAPSPASGSLASGSAAHRPPAPGGEPARLSLSAPKRVRIVSTHTVTMNAGGVVSVDSRLEAEGN